MAMLLEDVQKLFFPVPGKESRSIGAELEMIPLRKGTSDRVFAQEGTHNGAGFVAAIGREFRWTEERMGSDPSCWNFSDGRISFEPGGQIEFSSAVFPTASALVQSMERWTAVFDSRAELEGIELRRVGIDDRANIQDVPLQLHRERYAAMTRYFDSVGPYGVLMMRQTASLQVNVDRGSQPLERWRLLNALAPYLVAIFANSPLYAGTDSGHKSYRAYVWRMLDPRRTGIAYDPTNPAQGYLDFALDAPVILGARDNRYPAFRELLENSTATKEVWDVHLSTLFPEIRPREYFEIRSIDAIDPAHICAAIAFVAGLIYAHHSASAAQELLGDPDAELLKQAGQFGLNNSGIRERAAELVKLALAGCRSLGSAYISEPDLQHAEEYFRRYTLNGRSPADDRTNSP